MKRKVTLQKSMFSVIGFTCMLLCAQFALMPAYGQVQTRTYANFQGSYLTSLYALGVPAAPYGTVTNAASATDTDPQTSSTLNIAVAALNTVTVTQYLEFTTNGTFATPRTIASGTPVTVKVSVPSGLVNIAGGIEVGYFTALHTVAAVSPAVAGIGNQAGYDATRTAVYSGTSLVSALNGAGQIEVTFTPGASYNGAYVRVSSLLGAAITVSVYDAYIMENATPPVACDSRIDVLSGVRGNGLVNLASATGSVSSPANSIDASTATSSLMTTGTAVLSNVFQTIIFNSPSKVGDSVHVLLQDPGAGLLDVGVLSGLVIQPYLNNTPVGAAIHSNSPLLSLKLLSGAGNIYSINAAVNGSFDRVDLQLGGVAGVLSSIRIYDVTRIIPKPGVAGSPVVTADTVRAYAGQNVALTATPVSSTDGVNWYNTANAMIATSATGPASVNLTNVQPANTGYYVAQVTRNGCTETSARDTVYLKVLGVAVNPIVLPAGNLNTPYSQQLTVTGDLDLAPFTFSITSGALPNALTLNTTTGVISGTPAQIGTFNFTAQAADKNATVVATNNYSLLINALLPVTLVNFDAVKDGNNNVQLSWKTSNVVNFSHFDVQRSADGVRFSTIGTVDYNGSNYSFTDNHALAGVNHYRLKFVDVDGRYGNSVIRSVIMGRNNAVEIFPNPVRSLITLSTGNQLQGKVTVQVADLAGKVLKQEQKTATINSTITVDAGKLVDGIYMLTVITEDGHRAFTGRVMVKH